MLLPYFQAIEGGVIGETIRDSTWLFPFVEAFHLLALAVIGGAVLLVDFRLLGLGLKRQPVAELARDAQPWLIGSLIFMIGSGVPLFMSEATKCYYSFAFWTKMSALALAIIFTFTIRRRVTFADEARFSPRVLKAVGVISILLWSTVGWGGRWIGFS
ncbi:MAG TPA: DUF6644 family protein [Vicinamibacterales bacterium]|jgi:uncharacterized membrane protein YhdT